MNILSTLLGLAVYNAVTLAYMYFFRKHIDFRLLAAGNAAYIVTAIIVNILGWYL